MTVLSLAGASPGYGSEPLAPVSDTLDALLSSVSGAKPVIVLVHGADLASAENAVRDAGMARLTAFRKIGVVAAAGTADQVGTLRSNPGVTYVENNDPIQLHATSGTQATRSVEAQETLTGADGGALTGSGVGIAVIDTGIDPTHPAFRDEDGQSRVVANLKSLCLQGTATNCILPLPNVIDTDTLSLGGHGTHVAGIAAGSDYTLSGETRAGGSAPGAKLTSISTGAALVVLGTDAAMNWVLENHAAPCGDGVSAEECPPIKVINNSWGPTGGGGFDPNSAVVKLQRALAAEGVVAVWANGNDGGDGSENLSNPPAQDPTPGVLGVAAYHDQGTGTRDGAVSAFSSRGSVDDPQSWPDFSAPGENVLSACRPYLVICSQGLQFQNGPGALDIGTYNVISGTSMAAPQVAGIVAQLFQANPGASPAEIENALKATAYRYSDGAPYQQVGDYLSSFDKGAGLVDAVAAAKAVGAR